jgi:protein subunit release factor A
MDTQEKEMEWKLPADAPDQWQIEALTWPKGGQHVGTRTGVRVTHIPTGLSAVCETDRSQYRNRNVAVDMILGGLTSPDFRG